VCNTDRVAEHPYARSHAWSDRQSPPWVEDGRVARRAPAASTSVVRRRMQATKQRNTNLELRIRSLLHADGYRYYVDRSPEHGMRSRADLVFPRLRLAVYIDSCFWHCCPLHGTWPKANTRWWRDKLIGNAHRDLEVTRRLQQRGWSVLRIWEHEAPIDALKAVTSAITSLRAQLGRSGPS